MGAWSHEAFGNDDALDFLDIFLESPEGEGTDDEPGKARVLLGSLIVASGQFEPDEPEEGDEGDDDEEPLDPNAPLDAPEACEAIAAAEILATVLGRPSVEMMRGKDEDPEESALAAAFAWARKKGAKEKMYQHAELRQIAIAAVTKVRDKSELADLWAEAKPEDAKAWRDSIEDLLQRLK